MNNPFVLIDARLSNIENLLLDIKHKKLPNGSAEPDKLLTIDEAAKFLSLAKQTVYQLVSKGEIPHKKRSKRLYFSKVELLEYLNQGRVKSNQEIEAETLNKLDRGGNHDR